VTMSKIPSEIVPHLASVVLELRDHAPGYSNSYPTDAELVDYADNLSSGTKRYDDVKKHVANCKACQSKLVKLQPLRSTQRAWSDEELKRAHDNFIDSIESARGGTQPELTFAANAWYWRGDTHRELTRLRVQDFGLGRRLGDWLLLRETSAFALAEGKRSSLELTADLATDLRIGLFVTPTHIAFTHRDTWVLRIELLGENPGRRVQVDLLDQDNRSCGVRFIHSGKSADYEIDPPATGGYSMRVVWYGPAGKEAEREIAVPLRVGAAEDNA
jgi:hypothetical protein